MKEANSLQKILLLLAEIIVFAVLAVAASGQFGVTDGFKITAAYLAAYLVPCVVLSRARGTSLTARIILLALLAVLIYVDFTRLELLTRFDGYSLEEPNLSGDGRQYYKWALNQYDGRIPPVSVVYPGFPILMLVLWKVLGVNMVWPQAMNLMFVLTTVVLTGMTTRRLLSGRVKVSPRVLLVGGMLLCCLLSYMLIIGTSMLKEGSICISLAMTGFSISAMSASDEERHHLRRDLVIFVLACLLLGMVRTTYLYFVAMGVVIITLPHWRRDWMLSLGLLSAIGVALLLGNLMASYSFGRHAEIATGGWNMQRFYVIGESQQFYHDLLNFYFLRPYWYKMLMLPLTMSVQFFIPFPWTYYENPSLINVLARLTYGWYVVGGVALFYFMVISWRKDEHMGIWPWWPAMAYAAMACVMAGSVARYVVPIYPLFVPVAMFVLCRLYEGRWRKQFVWWSVCYVVVVTVVLLLCLEIQQATFSKMLHTQSLTNYLKGLPY